MTPIRRFLQVIRGQHRRYGLLVAGWVALRVGTLAVGLLLQRLFDTISGDASGGINLWSLLALLGSVEAARQLLQFNVVVTRLEPRIIHRTRAVLRDRILLIRLRGEAAADASDGQLVTIVGDDVDEVATFGALSPVHIARWVFAVVAIAILMSIDVLVATGVVVLLVAVALTTRLLYSRFVRHRAEGMRTAAQSRAVLREALANVETVQATRAEDHVAAHVHRVEQIRRDALVTERMFAELQQTTVANAVPLGTAIVLLAAAQGLKYDTLTVGDLALFGYYLQMLTEALASLGLLVVQLQRLSIALGRILRFSPSALAPPRERAETGPAGVDDGPAGAPTRLEILEVGGLACRADGDGDEASGVSFTAARGSLTVLVGRVGAGKSTALRGLLGLIPARGTVRWNGVPIADRGAFLVPPRSAYVPQSPRLFSGTLRENVELGGHCSDEQFEEAVRRSMLDRDLALMPDGPDTVIGPRGMRLSGGQQQRVAIARALIRRTELLILDDVASALDGETGTALWQQLRAGDTTIIAVTHDPSLLLEADTIVVLRGGAVVGQGRLADLLSDNAEMRRLWRAYLDGDPSTSAAPTG
ncbi:ABC transporter ATP-binding protein [Micromonospora ureilytica]|uniref:ABC transporter ATP-binding protein n=1 Tax=Micromonospora ureilytica TaxID=709868 RepID=UPI0033CFD44A